ncbi:MAG: DUF2070 family protein [Lachnospiraceae bacterium]|nr:DUF2070 family protein [Lachnospiraceae bacterium]
MDDLDDIRKERLIISISTLAGITCILQNHFRGWEFWVPFVLLISMIILWFLHVTEKLDTDSRINLYFIFAAFLLFYYGIHDTSLFDLSVSVALFMITFTVIDRNTFLNIIFGEYVILMMIQFWLLYNNGRADLSATYIMRIVYHIGTVLIMYVFSRITVNKRNAEKERMQQWIRTVNENDHDMEDFLSNISHELRTPVNVISGMTALLQKDNDSKELLTIRDAEIKLAHQIEDIQDYTEIKRGELFLEEENYTCISLINDVIENYKALCQKDELELLVDISPMIPSVLKGDIKKLHKLFRLLLENAVKFTKRGGIFVKVFPVFREYGINLTIDITDTGTGMTRADISGISKGMYQANKKRNRSTGGIGIGLPIVYGFVHKMGGFVKINSSKGNGTSIRICIPQKVVNPEPCLSVKNEAGNGIVFYNKPEKYKVPQVREFYDTMVSDIAEGLKIRLYPTGDRRGLKQLANGINISHVFTGREEYETDRDILDELSKQGCRIVVFSDEGLVPVTGGNVLTVPKPVCVFTIVRIINGDESFEICNEDSNRKPVFDGVRALVVDDEPMNLVVASGMFRGYRMSVDTAESGKEAIRKYENGEYDVIFMDHMMPGMDGVETMKNIRQIADSHNRAPLIIALTANVLSGAKRMFIDEGFDGFIAKPIDIKEFERVMKYTLPEKFISYEGRDGL